MKTGLHYQCSKCGEVYLDALYECPCCHAECLVVELNNPNVDVEFLHEKFLEYRELSGDEGIERMRELAKLGSTFALQWLAFSYELGTRVKRDEEMAFHLYMAAALGGSELAALSVGEAYRDGKGVQPNPEQAYRWFKLASERGEPSEELANCYFDGIGTACDVAEGLAVLRRFGDKRYGKAFYLDGFCRSRCRIAEICSNQLDGASSLEDVQIPLAEVYHTLFTTTGNAPVVKLCFREFLFPTLDRVLSIDAVKTRWGKCAMGLFSYQCPYTNVIGDMAQTALFAGALNQRGVLERGFKERFDEEV